MPRIPRKRKGKRSYAPVQETAVEDDGKSRTLPTTPPEVNPPQPIIPAVKSGSGASVLNPSDMQKMVMDKIKLLQEQRDRQRADNFQNPDYVNKNIITAYEKLERLIVGAQATGEIKKLFLESSQFGLYLAKKFPRLTRETEIASARLEKFKALCTRLQEERAMMKTKLADIEGREKTWREKLEGQFKNSIKDIKDQIGKHEGQNQDIIKHNEKMSEKMEIMRRQNKLLKEAVEMRDKASKTEKKRLIVEFNAASRVRNDLATKVKESMDENKKLETELLQYRGKYDDIQQALQKSGQTIDKVKEVKDKQLTQNRVLSKRNEEYLRNAQSWKGKIEVATSERDRTENQVKAMQRLCRSLKEKNRELKTVQPPMKK